MDDFTYTRLLRFFVAQVPTLVKTAVWHSLWLSPTSNKIDLRTALMIKMARAFFSPVNAQSFAQQQAFTLKDPGIKGKMWISKITLPVPEEDVLQTVLGAVESLQEGIEKYTAPTIVPVTAEWTGYRPNVDATRPRLDLSEAQHYERLMAEVSSDVTILYLHGGAFYLCDPCTHRKFVSKLARLTGGRGLSVRYRLSPQHAFPAALLDSFIAYLSLLSPPPGSFHTAVPASEIVVCGDSAGGNLTLSLLQLLLHLNRSSPAPTVRFHGRDVPVSLPAGVATSSAWVDLTRCMPSTVTKAELDYLPPPYTREDMERRPRCELWPTDPPRGDIYCDTTMYCHPLVSPLAASDWRGACPMWFGYGEEMLLDEGKTMAAKAAQQAVPVVWEQWEALPHCFAQILEGLPASKRFFADWAGFCMQVVDPSEKPVSTKGVWFEAKTGKEKEVDVKTIGVMSEEDVLRRMREVRKLRGGREMTVDEVEEKISPKL